jgi:hypothetical protein
MGEDRNEPDQYERERIRRLGLRNGWIGVVLAAGGFATLQIFSQYSRYGSILDAMLLLALLTMIGIGLMVEGFTSAWRSRKSG